MKIVIDSAIPYIQGIFEPYAEVLYMGGNEFCPEAVGDADVLIIRTRTRCNESLLQGSSVKLIATATIGFDHIDLDYCARQGIKVTTAQGCNAAAVLQWVAAALALDAQMQGWHPCERTLGIVGVGNVGSLVEQYAQAWGFRIMRCDPPRQKREKDGQWHSFEQVMSHSDIVTLHTPLNAQTFHLVNQHTIALMPKDALLINASRGEVAQSEAMLAASQRLMIDVWENEPNINLDLLERAIVSTPHIAGYSSQGKANATAMVVDAVARHFSLPLQGWYPPMVSPVAREAIGWEQMCATITKRCDLLQQSQWLKSNHSAFESLRNTYALREEYF